MSRTDRAWRIAGFLAMAAGYAVPLAGDAFLSPTAQRATAVLVGMPLALAGALLMVQGDRVVRILRVERGRHRELIGTIRARRMRSIRSRRGRRSGAGL